MEFEQSFPSMSLIEMMGDTVTYSPAGGEAIDIKAVVDRNVERIGSDGFTLERRTEIEFLLESAPYPTRGDVITYLNKSYIVDGIVFDDGTLVRVAVR